VSSADVSYLIDCPSCSCGWRIDGRRLVNVKSEAPYNAASREERARYAALRHLCDPLIDSYFLALAAKTKTAEHAEMVTRRLFRQVSQLSDEQRETKSCSEVAYGLRNHDWLANQARQLGVGSEFERLIKELEDAKKRSSEGHNAIILQPIPDLKLGIS
jgi:hypothetical protein